MKRRCILPRRVGAAGKVNRHTVVFCDEQHSCRHCLLKGAHTAGRSTGRRRQTMMPPPSRKGFEQGLGLLQPLPAVEPWQVHAATRLPDELSASVGCGLPQRGCGCAHSCRRPCRCLRHQGGCRCHRGRGARKAQPKPWVVVEGAAQECRLLLLLLLLPCASQVQRKWGTRLSHWRSGALQRRAACARRPHRKRGQPGCCWGRLRQYHRLRQIPRGLRWQCRQRALHAQQCLHVGVVGKPGGVGAPLCCTCSAGEPQTLVWLLQEEHAGQVAPSWPLCTAPAGRLQAGQGPRAGQVGRQAGRTGGLTLQHDKLAGRTGWLAGTAHCKRT